ncbi:hypothetical protein CICLE_v10023433mg [Citrus x clementina]|uniref:Uncharacterized protein n=2 Tax=Citrus TaxID=2706 RepID=A0A067H5C8_CITSI|nr:hypothetical protein CICLE_v10023433mg [Citrus x clementina]KDO87178.1 hypothetical protein CISIN_1g045816mg [Citrus sinensis]
MCLFNLQELIPVSLQRHQRGWDRYSGEGEGETAEEHHWVSIGI